MGPRLIEIGNGLMKIRIKLNRYVVGRFRKSIAETFIYYNLYLNLKTFYL